MYYKVCAVVDAQLVSVCAGLDVFPDHDWNQKLIRHYVLGSTTHEVSAPSFVGTIGAGLCVFDNYERIGRFIAVVMQHRPAGQLKCFEVDAIDVKTVDAQINAGFCFSGELDTLLCDAVTLLREVPLP